MLFYHNKAGHKGTSKYPLYVRKMATHPVWGKGIRNPSALHPFRRDRPPLPLYNAMKIISTVKGGGGLEHINPSALHLIRLVRPPLQPDNAMEIATTVKGGSQGGLELQNIIHSSFSKHLMA